MRDLLSELFASKKFIVLLGGGLTTVALGVAGHFGLALDQSTANDVSLKILGLVGSYLLAQGAADHGKEAATIHAEAAAK